MPAVFLAVGIPKLRSLKARQFSLFPTWGKYDLPTPLVPELPLAIRLGGTALEISHLGRLGMEVAIVAWPPKPWCLLYTTAVQPHVSINSFRQVT